ncbi:hypothetical protein Taro_009815 [Colocasia esculenta]|uniref:Uncharacterized protein n=1 Tax=Colocasia esculenta TaxID=4460 RepID=A0A843TXA0_COLES|nr:hypothetical protein [Colocasia esculenta]
MFNSMDGRGKGLETSSLEEPTIGGSFGGVQDTPAGDAHGASATPDFTAFMQLFQGFVQTMMRNPGIPQQGRGAGISLIEKFKKMGPLTFIRTSQLEEVEGWLREMKKIVKAIRCAEEDKVTLATYILQDRADDW